MEIVHETIFFYSGGYNFLHRQVCKKFREIIAEVGYVEYLENLFREKQSSNPVPSKKLAKMALNAGSVYLLEVCIDFISERSICEKAAKKGKLQVLQWARSKNYPWDVYTTHYAARYGHLEILKWVRLENCLWDKRTCSNAAYGGQLEILQWLRSNGCPWGSETCYCAAVNGHLEILKWARTNGWFYRNAIKFFTKHSFVKNSWDSWVCSAAARGGNLEILQWLRINGWFHEREILYKALLCIKPLGMKLFATVIYNSCNGPEPMVVLGIKKLTNWFRVREAHEHEKLVFSEY